MRRGRWRFGHLYCRPNPRICMQEGLPTFLCPAHIVCAMRNMNKGWVWHRRLGKCFGRGRQDWARRGAERLHRRCPESEGRAPAAFAFCALLVLALRRFLRCSLIFFNSRGRPGRAVRVLAGGRNRDRSRRRLRFRHDGRRRVWARAACRRLRLRARRLRLLRHCYRSSRCSRPKRCRRFLFASSFRE